MRAFDGLRAAGVLIAAAILVIQVYPEGTHFLIPWVEWPIIYDVRAQPNIVSSTSGSRDLQMVRPGPVSRQFARESRGVLSGGPPRR